MALYRLSGPAQQDIADVLAASLERWGEAGRARYADLLLAAFREAAVRPVGRRSRLRDELGRGIRSLHLHAVRKGHRVRTPVHIVFFRVVEPGVVEIIRVLHERMDPLRHISRSRASAT